jgi:TonB-dependent starch-binding outer membrane protein SusC
MNKHFFSKCSLLFLGILFLAFNLNAQQGTIKGTVTDANGSPIIGATILVEGTTQGAVSDIDGKYTIPGVTDGSQSITVNSVGYLKETQSLTVTADQVTELNFLLIEDLQQLSEVVVIGYGVQKKSDLTGAISSVSSDDLEKIPSTGVSNLLQGKAAGVVVLQNSGQPGSAPSIRVRGLATVNGGTPLIVIDGISGGNLTDLNPSDIESIEILKDAASQSIYGSAGGNGVILVTTKKGKEGKLQAKFDLYTGVQTAWKRKMNIANAQQFAELYNLQQEINGLEVYFPKDAGSGQYLDPETNGTLNNTDWINEVLRAGIVQNYNLSLSGGNKFSTFFLGVDYNSEQGTLLRTSNNRITLRLNSEHKILKRFTVGENFNFSQNNYRSQDERNEYNSPLSTAVQVYPFIPVMATDNSGNYAYRGAGISGSTNPRAQIQYNNNLAKNQSFNGNVFMRAGIINGLTFESRFGMGYTPYEFRKFVPEHILGNIDNPSASQSPTSSEYGYNISSTNTWQWQNFFNYSFTFMDKNNVDITAGYESGYYKNDYTNRSQSYDTVNFATTDWLSFAYADTMAIIQQKMVEATNYAFFVRLNYDLAGILLLQANFRRDYSSKFGPNNRIGNFPSISAGIKFSEFEFVKRVNFISFGKIRAGYGATGNSDIQPFQYLSTIGSLTMQSYPFGDVVQPGAGLITAGNPDLKWESVVTQNIGTDLTFFKNKLSFSFDLFSRKNKDMLLRKSVPYYFGYVVSDAGNELGDSRIDTRPLVNYGTLNNKGFEITLGYNNQSGDFKYDVNANITRAITTIDDIGDPLYAGSGRGVSNICRTQNDGPVSAFYGYKTDGIFQEDDFTWFKDATGDWDRIVVDPTGSTIVTGTDAAGNAVEYHTLDRHAAPGNFRYVDANGDGQISTLDMVQIGDPNPDFTFGLGANLTYKNFDLNLFFQGSYGNDIFNLLKVNLYTTRNGGLNLSSDLLDSYIPAVYDVSNPNAIPTPLVDAQNVGTGIIRMDGSLAASDFYVEDGSYIRLKNIQLGYTFPVSSLEKLKVKKLRIYAGALNLLTFTKYSGFDPEVNETTLLERGFDRGTYPQSRMYNLGVNLIF